MIFSKSVINYILNISVAFGFIKIRGTYVTDIQEKPEINITTDFKNCTYLIYILGFLEYV